MRLVPASRVFSQLERAVRDAAESLGKRATFEALGGNARLEGHVLLPMRDALLHMVRNAVDHGIESETERLATGKPAAGKVQVSLVRKGNRLVFTCADDGRGIDLEAVRQAALQHGVIGAADALSPDDLVKLILRAGVSTTSAVTTFSGRGIGLDVVRETVSKLAGELSIQSSPGQGTTLSISVPLSLSSIPSLVVQAGETVAAIPLSALRQALRVKEPEISRTAVGATVLHDGVELPFRPLAEILNQASAFEPAPAAFKPRNWTLIIIEAQASRAALGVDRILGVSEVVLRPLPATAGAIPLVAGASFDAEGHPQPMLDPRSLVEAARMEPSLAKPAPRKPKVLVIDDSLTTRMLEESILESAGYAVALATSAEEGLAMAKATAYDLFLVDVEMPGMDGFAFLGRIRADAKLSRVPAVMVTSRNAPEDRRRGMEAGARAYLVKSEFHQGHFLKTIDTLLSEAHG
jgi:two-component system chemotaxis sensor kinase CheA